MKPDDAIAEASCSFCGKAGQEARHLISGVSALICHDCVDACVEVMASAQREASVISSTRLLKPVKIREHLDQYVIGQDHAKKALAVALHNHYKRLSSLGSIDGCDLQKSNVLLIGPTGSGKTLLVRTLGKLLDVPFVIVDATSFTQAGYIGEDVEQIIAALLRNADDDVERCERGIIYIDEIDKIARKSTSQSLGRDISGEGVQQALLKLVEGTIARIPKQGPRNRAQPDMVNVDTSRILFICGGAFSQLEDLIRVRLSKKAMGFGNGGDPVDQRAELLKEVRVQDLVDYGMIPEFMGRLPVIAVLDSLDIPSLVRILTEPKDALIRQYQRLVGMDGVTLDFTTGAIQEIARIALERGSGARGLRAILEGVLLEIMYQVPSMPDVETITISEELVLSPKTMVMGT